MRGLARGLGEHEQCNATFLCVHAGFLCDMMGLGKTLETLMLVLANPAPADWAVTSMEDRMRSSDSDPIPIKTTLIVMPANLLTQWQEEVQLHVKDGALTWFAPQFHLLKYELEECQLRHLCSAAFSPASPLSDCSRMV